MSPLFINPDRLWQDIMILGQITDPEQPWTRRSFTARYDEGRHWVSQQMLAAGLDVSIDAAGNLVGRRESEHASASAVVIGSHTDTVPSGGRFDGIAGVCAGIEIARTLRDHGYRNTHPIEVIDFLAEEPSAFGQSCIGSRGLAGALTPDMLASRDPDGRLLSDAIAASGGVPSRLTGVLRHDIAAYFELHIEQARVLESASVSVGIVTSIAGVTRAVIAFEGAADHAGATPLGHRADALLAASQTIIKTREEAEHVASRSPAYFVATIGKIDIKPNAANVIPGHAEFVVDVRSEDICLTDRFFAVLDQATTAFAKDNGVTRCRFEIISRSSPAICDATLRDTLDRSARSLGITPMPIASGAGHDAMFMALIAPTAMVFVPCRDGRSHCPEEWAEKTDLADGTNTMLRAIETIDVMAGTDG